MHLIQEMISVRVQVATTHTICHISRFTGSFWSNVPHTRKSNRVGGCCTKHHEGHSSTRSRKEKSYPQHDNFEKTANARCVRIPTSQHGSLKYHAVNALTQLEDFVKEKKYADVAQTLAVRILRNLSPRTRLTWRIQAVKQISVSFKPYTSVQRISQVWRHIQELQGELRTHLDHDFDALQVVSLSLVVSS
jgi:hypothetical protein